MRFIITLTTPADATPPAAGPPFDEKMFVAHMNYNEEMHRAGVLVAAEGLNPTEHGAHVVVSGATRTVVDGPYAETKELVGGFYLLEVKSRQEAIEWASRYPGSIRGGDEILEIRQLTGEGDLPPRILELITAAAPTWSATFRRG